MTRILTNLLISFVLLLVLLATLGGMCLFVATYGEQSFLYALFFMLAMFMLYLLVALYRGDL